MNEPREPLHQPPNPADLRRAPPAGVACAQVRRWLRDFVDGDLDRARCGIVEVHAHGCRTCAIELARAEHELLRIRRLFAVVDPAEPELPADFAARVVDRLLLDETSFPGTSFPGSSFPGSSPLAEDPASAAERADDPGSSLASEPSGNQPDVSVPDGALPDGSLGKDGASGKDDAPGKLSVPPAGNQSGSAQTGTSPRLRMPVSPAAVASRRFRTLRGGRLEAGGFVVAVLLALTGLALGFEFFSSTAGAPQHLARLVLVAADGTYSRNGRPIGPGEGLGDLQSLWVVPGGGARVDWHDRSPRPQPAATLQVHGNGELSLQDGVPLVVNGRVDIATYRPVSIQIGDGSRLDLGIGEYVIAAEVPELGDLQLQPGDDPLDGAPEDLRVSVEVVDGQPASVMRAGINPTLVAAGQIGVYQGGGAVAIGSGGGIAVSPQGASGTRTEPGDPTAEAAIIGHVFDRSGSPSVGAEVLLSFTLGGMAQTGNRITGADGRFEINPGHACQSEFAIVLAMPASVRRELGMLAPDASQLIRQGVRSQLAAPLVFDLSTAFTGTLLDDQGQGCSGVQVVPCIVDELFGQVLTLVGERAFSAADGSIRIEQLPARLPAHQSLMLLVTQSDLEPIAIPIPTRGLAVANEPFGSLPVRRLRAVRLHMLPPNMVVEVFEEITGLPAGSGAWRRTAVTDAWGRVSSMATGWGRMWVRFPGNQLLRELVLDDFVGLPRYRPAPGSAKPWASVFRPLQAVPDSQAEVSTAYRHQHFQVTPPENAASGQALRVVDGLERAIAGAQVFAVEHVGSNNGLEVRFLGFTSPTGVVSLRPVQESGDIVVVGPDGATGLLAAPRLLPHNVTLPLQLPGRVLLHESLRPNPATAVPVPIRFERIGETLPGMASIAHRFASGLGGWEVGGLPPGPYRAIVNETVREIVVPADGFFVMQ